MYLVAMLFGHNANVATALLFPQAKRPIGQIHGCPPVGLRLTIGWWITLWLMVLRNYGQFRKSGR